MKSTKLAALLFAASMSLAAAAPAFAAPVSRGGPANGAQTNIPVTLDVSASCTIGATGLAFAGYNGQAASTAYNADLLDVTCTNGAPYVIRMGNGSNGGDDGQSYLVSTNAAFAPQPGGQLAYEIFQDAANTIAWNGVNGPQPLSMVGTGALQQIPGSAKIPAGQLYFVGGYADTVPAIINF